MSRRTEPRHQIWKHNRDISEFEFDCQSYEKSLQPVSTLDLSHIIINMFLFEFIYSLSITVELDGRSVVRIVGCEVFADGSDSAVVGIEDRFLQQQT